MNLRHHIEGYNVDSWSCTVTGCECDHYKVCVGRHCDCNLSKVCPRKDCDCGHPKVCPNPSCICGSQKILTDENCSGAIIRKCSDPTILAIGNNLKRFDGSWGGVSKDSQDAVCESLTHRFGGKIITIHGNILEYGFWGKDSFYYHCINFRIETGFLWPVMAVVKVSHAEDNEKKFFKGRTMDIRVKLNSVEVSYGSVVILHCEVEDDVVEDDEREDYSSDSSMSTSSGEFGIGFYVHLLITIMLVAYCFGSVGGCISRFGETNDGFYALTAFKTTGVSWAITVAIIYLSVWVVVYFGKKLNK